MANFPGGPGIPGSRQWDEYFDSFTRQMQNVKDNIKEAVAQAFEDDGGEGLGTVRDMLMDDGGLRNMSNPGSVGQRQGAGDASATGLPVSSKSKKRPADTNSESGQQSAKRRKVKTDCSNPDEADSKSKEDSMPEDSVANESVQDAPVPDDHVSDEDFAYGFVSDASLVVTDSTFSSASDQESVASSIISDRESVASSIISDPESVIFSVSDQESIPSISSDRESVASSIISDRESVASSIISDRESVASSIISDRESVASSVSDRESIPSSASNLDATDPSVSDLDPPDSSKSDTDSSTDSSTTDSSSQESDNEGDDNEWSWQIGNSNYVQKSVYSSDGTVCHSGNTTVNGNFISWTGYQHASMQSFNGRRFQLSNTGNSDFHRFATQDSVILEMDGIRVTVRPRNGIPLDGIEISLSNEGLLIIEIPDE